ncbi:MAG: O-antigen ligase family protein [Sphingomonadaceae bacterium]|nr:O-antigen ligase family protein [Sphingomonadaceae bacterium]
MTAARGTRRGFSLGSDKTRLAALALFLAAVFAMGGGARDDIASLIVLRPLAAIFAGYALIAWQPGDLAGLRVPLLFLAALAAIIAAQLIPLPPDIWQSLPNRETIAEIGRLMGDTDAWRPITLSPSKTANALASLIVPLAALLLFAIQSDDNRRLVILLIIGCAVASAALSFLQIATGGAEPLYFYRITNDANPVGLFANRNHNAVFLAASLALVVAEAARALSRRDREPGALRMLLLAAAAILIVIVNLVNGSRAGLLLMAVVVAFAAMFLRRVIGDASKRTPRRKTGYRDPGKWVPAAVVAGAIGLAALFIGFSRSQSFDRAAGTAGMDDLRLQALPTLIEMAQNYLPFGAGFGSFEHVYRIHETDEMFAPAYLNNAHNDALQWIIEGGLPAFLLAIGFAAWFILRFVSRWRGAAAASYDRRTMLCAAVFLAALALASLVDYPLRVPSLMAVSVILVCLCAAPRTRRPSTQPDNSIV